MSQPGDATRHRLAPGALLRRIAEASLALVLIGSAPAAEEPAAPAPRARGKLWVSPVEYSECANESAFVRGETVLITGGDLLPNEPVAITFSQDDGEQPLASAHANEKGMLAARVVIPASARTEQEARIRATAEQGERGGGIVLVSAPLQIFADARDSDGDGFKDPCDNCPALASAQLVDSDLDGSGDDCDPCPNDAENDSDADGQCADVDPDPYDPTPSPAG